MIALLEACTNSEVIKHPGGILPLCKKIDNQDILSRMLRILDKTLYSSSTRISRRQKSMGKSTDTYRSVGTRDATLYQASEFTDNWLSMHRTDSVFLEIELEPQRFISWRCTSCMT